MPHTRLAACVALALAGAGAAAGATLPADYDVTTYPVIVSEPGMRDVTVKKGTWGAGLAYEVTRPAGLAPGAKAPAVVFVNGVGLPIHEWEIYRSWARLVAAHGMAGITFDSKARGDSSDVAAFLAYVAKNADALGVDASRVAAWMCSANVAAGFPAAMAAAPSALRAIVVYYGAGEAPALRKDLPVYWALAGRDNARLVERQKALFERAVKEGVPWTMVVAPDLPHAFDAVETTPNSRRVVRETVAFLETHLAPAAPPADVPLPKRATGFVYANEPRRAEAVYREILARDPADLEAARRLGVSEYNEACRLALAGRRDEAFAWLNRAADDGFRSRTHYEGDADLESLRADPRWTALLTRLTR